MKLLQVFISPFQGFIVITHSSWGLRPRLLNFVPAGLSQVHPAISKAQGANRQPIRIDGIPRIRLLIPTQPNLINAAVTLV